MESEDPASHSPFPAGAALMSGTIRGTYVRRKDRKAYSYTLSWASTSRDLTWSATLEGRDDFGSVSRTSGTLDVAAGMTAPKLEQMARSAAHAAIEKADEGAKGRLAMLRAALRRISAADATRKP